MIDLYLIESPYVQHPLAGCLYLFVFQERWVLSFFQERGNIFEVVGLVNVCEFVPLVDPESEILRKVFEVILNMPVVRNFRQFLMSFQHRN